MRIHGFAMGVAGMVAVAASWLPAPVRACSCTPQALHKFAADPKDGAIDVPLNAAAVFSGAFQSGSVVVEDGAGQPVDVAITEAGLAGPCGGKWAEVVPKQPWAPHTTYRIRVTSSYPVGLKPGEDFLSFTTGDVSLPDPDLAMPKAHVSLMRDFPETSCGPTPRRDARLHGVPSQSSHRKASEAAHPVRDRSARE